MLQAEVVRLSQDTEWDADVLSCDFLRERGLVEVRGWWILPIHHADIAAVDDDIRPAYLGLRPSKVSPYWRVRLKQVQNSKENFVELTGRLWWLWGDIRTLLASLVSD
jgi:hypothetical protein